MKQIHLQSNTQSLHVVHNKSHLRAYGLERCGRRAAWSGAFFKSEGGLFGAGAGGRADVRA